jgi:tight adherence protein B
MATVLIPVGVFLVVVLITVALYLAVTGMPKALEERRVEKRLKEISKPAAGAAATATAASLLVKEAAPGPLPVLDRFVGSTERGFALGRWIEQSGMRISLSKLLLLSLLCAGVLAAAALPWQHIWWLPLVLAAIGGAVPFMVVKQKRKTRLKKFEEEFPEALDLMARAVRAGHAFTTGIKMVAEEMPDPVGPEFRKTFDEQNFGLSMQDSLDNLALRVPSLDMKFFVTAVLIQRETGGNLSEILENLSLVVRERFKILRQVRVYTAHGRFTGYVLLGLPAALAIALMFINPDHMNLLFREPLGQKLLMTALGMQFFGYLWIRQIIKIEV